MESNLQDEDILNLIQNLKDDNSYVRGETAKT